MQTCQGLACLVQRKSHFHPCKSFCPISVKATQAQHFVPLAVYASSLLMTLIELSTYPSNKKRKDVLRLASSLGNEMKLKTCDFISEMPAKI